MVPTMAKNKMNKIFTIICYLFQLFLLASCNQKNKTVPETFLNLLNRYNTDSLRLVTSDNFQLEEQYVHYVSNKAAFLDSFVSFSKAINGKFNIIKKEADTEPMVFIAEDISDYIKYFKLKPPMWKFTISTKDGKVEKMISDTTVGYQAYLNKFMVKHDHFYKWLSSKYPGETENYLFHDKSGLLSARLKEYADFDRSL